jgi:hypothetical protein
MAGMEKTGKPAQSTGQRIIWFLVGAVVNYLLISTPYGWLKKNTEFAPWALAACSLAVSTTFFFIWNYFVNFRTASRKREAFPRYLAVVAVMYVISTSLLTLFKSIKGGLELQVAGSPIDLDIVALQLCLGWVKFIVYHKWAFPAAKGAISDSESQP